MAANPFRKCFIARKIVSGSFFNQPSNIEHILARFARQGVILQLWWIHL